MFGVRKRAVSVRGGGVSWKWCYTPVIRAALEEGEPYFKSEWCTEGVKLL